MARKEFGAMRVGEIGGNPLNVEVLMRIGRRRIYVSTR
jgi:hypothetical protein